MKTSHHRHFASLIAVATLTFAAGCHKKAVPPPPPPPPAANVAGADGHDHSDAQHHQPGRKRSARLAHDRCDGSLD